MSDDLLFETAPRPDTRWTSGGRRPWPWRAVLLLAPAVALVGAVLLLPLLATFKASLDGWGRHYWDVVTDEGVRGAFLNSVRWLIFAPLVCLGGLFLARLGRGARRRSRALLVGVLAAPIAVSALVSAVAFRLIFDPRADRGTVNALLGTEIGFLGPGWIWVVLGSAFAWQWIGLTVVVFRAGLGEIPRDLLRVARTLGIGPRRRLTGVIVPALVPVAAPVLVIVLVATARIFEVVLVGVPGSMQERVDVVGLRWWRGEAELSAGGRAALGVLMFLIIAGVALACLRGLSREWPSARPGPVPAAPERSARARWTLRVLGVLAIVFWVMPLVVLLATSAHTPGAAARTVWWRGEFGLDSYRRAFESGELADALLSTGGRAIGAAILLLLVAVPAAYALAWGGLSRTTVRVLIGITAVLAVVPPQAVVQPLGDAFGELRLFGAPTALIVVHAAFGVPLAVLLLRNAFARVPWEDVRAGQLEPEPTSALRAVARRSWPAVLTVAVLEFVLVWNDFIIGLLLGGPEAGQLMLVLFEESRQFTTASGVMAAGAVVSVVLPLVLVLATGRWLVRGLTAGVGR